MKTTIKRKVKCTGCIRFQNASFDECVEPVPLYIPKEQNERWMKLYHKNQTRCPYRLTPERLKKGILELGK